MAVPACPARRSSLDRIGTRSPATPPARYVDAHFPASYLAQTDALVGRRLMDRETHLTPHGCDGRCLFLSLGKIFLPIAKPLRLGQLPPLYL